MFHQFRALERTIRRGAISEDDGFEIIGGNRDWARAPIAVISPDQFDQAVIQRGLLLGWDRVKGAQRWTVVSPEELDILLGGPVSKDRGPRIGRNRRCTFTEEIALVRLIAPEDRRLEVWRRRQKT